MMSKNNPQRSVTCWLLPIVLALPFIAGLTLLAVRFGPLVAEALEVAAKLVVIP